ncbi:MAG TPA: SPOR domain-containing protein [Candidatus Binatia bacterium]|jgi:cell division septation protein DedD
MATRQARRQLQLTSFEMTLVAVSFVVTVTTVFFFGLFVGKKNASFHAPAEDRVARIPVDDFTKYKRPEPIEKPAKAAPVAAASASSGKPAAAPDKNSASSNTAEPVAAVAKVDTPADSKAQVAAAPVAAATPATKPAPVSIPAGTTAKEAQKDAKAKEAAAAKEKEKEKDDAEPARGHGYTVQILQTRKQVDADQLVQKLKAHGYAAYIKKVSDGDDAWYRVRVGSYSAFGEARAAADRCHQEMGLGQAFVSTE